MLGSKVGVGGWGDWGRRGLKLGSEGLGTGGWGWGVGDEGSGCWGRGGWEFGVGGVWDEGVGVGD